MTADPLRLTGTLSSQRLFVGSKSEGFYPVLDAEDGTRYRLRVSGGMSESPHDPLAPFYGARVRVQGQADRLRGHWRLTLSSGPQGVDGIELLPLDPESEA